MQSDPKNYRFTSHPILLGCVVVWTAWLIMMVRGDYWHHFTDKWFMTLTMMFGSFVAGATSEGGGAVAFPVMTLLFKIKPAVARDFSLMIQSVGMTAAAFTIICLKIKVSWRAVIFSGLGGIFGVVLGMDVIGPMLPPAYAKVFFTSFWLSFALALYAINRTHDRQVYEAIPFESRGIVPLLFMTGIVGGIVSGITGSGLDIATFAMLVLGFRVCEKVATPTSVLLMASNAVFGFFWRGTVGQGTGLAEAAWHYWYVCIPIVVVGAPMGAWFIKGRSRAFVAGFLYLSISIQYIAALIILPQTARLIAFNLGTLAIGSLFFAWLVHVGNRFSYQMKQDENL